MLFIKEIVDGRTKTDIEGSQKLTEHFVLRWAKNSRTVLNIRRDNYTRITKKNKNKLF